MTDDELDEEVRRTLDGLTLPLSPDDVALVAERARLVVERLTNDSKLQYHVDEIVRLWPRVPPHLQQWAIATLLGSD